MGAGGVWTKSGEGGIGWGGREVGWDPRNYEVSIFLQLLSFFSDIPPLELTSLRYEALGYSPFHRNYSASYSAAAASRQSPPGKDYIDRKNLSISSFVKRDADPQGGGNRRPFGGNTRRQNTQRLSFRSVFRQIPTPRPFRGSTRRQLRLFPLMIDDHAEAQKTKQL